MSIQTIAGTSARGLRPDRSARSAVDVRPAAAPGSPANPADGAIARAITAVNAMLDPMARGLQFSIDQATGTTVVKLVDTETREVLREMPSREMLAIARALDRVSGALIYERA
jgi:flagellar protein FlaG